MRERKKAICHDCLAVEGGIHEYGCDMESCPFCGNQLISCQCSYANLGIDCSPGTEVYQDGLSGDQEAAWLDILTAKGRIPYVQWPNLCSYCGALWPELFSVPDEEWEAAVEPRHRNEMLCRSCLDWIERIILEGKTALAAVQDAEKAVK